MNMLQDFWLFFLEVVWQWAFLITGSVLTAAVFLVDQRWPGLVSKRSVFAVFGWGYFVVAAFLAWRAERVVRPGPEVQYYDSVIRADQDWRIMVNDRNNAGTRFTVELVRGNLRVILENRRGLSRTGLQRTVRVEAPMGAPPP